MLEIRDIEKTFYKTRGVLGRKEVSVRAVDKVSLHVCPGQHLGIVGESGSGKTTLARLMIGLYTQDQGKIVWDPETFGKMRQCRHVQMVFQDPFSSLDPRYRIRQILAEALNLSGRTLSRHERRQEFVQVMESVGLSRDMLDRFPHAFSGGERQRIAIARAIIMRPKLLILDEAVSSLDVIVQKDILALLIDLEKAYGLTYIFITHDLRAVRSVCSRIAVMWQGKIVEMGSAQDVFENSIHPYTRQLVSAAITFSVAEERSGEKFYEKNTFCDKGNGHFVLE